MYLHLISRFFILFFLVIIISSLTSIFLIEQNNFSFSLLLDQLIYYIPHALISSILVLYSIFLYKKDKKSFNKNLSNGFTFKTVGIVFIFIFLGLLLIAANFYYHEFIKVDNNIPKVELESSEWEYLKSLEKVDISLQNQLMDFVLYIQTGEYASAAKILDKIKKNSEKDNAADAKIISTFLRKVLDPIVDGHDGLTEDAAKKVKNFEQAYRYFQSRRYTAAIRIFSKSRYKYKNYFIQKAKVARDFIKLNDKKEASIKALLELGEAGLSIKAVQFGEYENYLKSLNTLFPNNEKIDLVLRKQEIEVKTFAKDFNNNSSNSPLKKKIVIIENKLTLQYGKRNKKMNFGKSLLFIGELFIQKGDVYFKDMTILPNIDTAEKMMPAYYVKLAHWKRTKDKYLIEIEDMENLVKNVHLIPNKLDGKLRPDSSFISFNDLIVVNKVIKYGPKLSIFDLEEFYNVQGESNYIPGVFHVYMNEKLAYYITSILLWILAVTLGLILRIRYEKVLSWFIIVPMTLFIIVFSNFTFYSVKQVILMLLS